MVVNRDGVVAEAQETIVVINRAGAADAAVVTTRLTRSDGSTIVDQTERVWVRPDGDGFYTLNLTVPEPELSKGSLWTVHALLAPGAKNKGNPDAEQPPAIDGGRVTLIWTGTADPLVPIIWNYL